MEPNGPGRGRTASRARPWPGLAARTVAALLFTVPLAAQERTLFWKGLDVEARLEASGALHITERHRMVFDGDWNGGERSFRVEPGQTMELISFTRVDPRTMASIPLRASTSPAMQVDQFAWADRTKLRWRARRATDPPFRQQEITYVIEYRLFGAIVPERDRYLLHHDFAFADRPGVIERYSLQADVDPAWDPAPGFEPRIERAPLPRGQSVILKVPLAWIGPGEAPRLEKTPAVAPRSVWPPPEFAAGPDTPQPRLSAALKLAGLAVFLGLSAALWWTFDRAEAAVRRGADPEVSPAWLEENIFVHRPEVVGAAWDRETGEAEAAALIAMMAVEGKIENVTSPPKLKLLVPRESLSGYERSFVDRLFPRGDEIEPAQLKSYYASTGFHPARAIAAELDRKAKAVVGTGSGVAGAGCLGALMGVAGLTVAGAVLGEKAVPTLGMLGTLLFLATLWLSASYQGEPKGRGASALIPVPLAILAVAAMPLVSSAEHMVLVLVFILALVALMLRGSRWSGSALELQNLRNLRAARAFFRERLQAGASVEERWVPYLLGFGLGTELDHWFVAAPAREALERTSPLAASSRQERSSPSTPGADNPGPAFQPRGGAFGGAGASGSWASSIGTFAQGVAGPISQSNSPSSRSSSWSSSSSSSSSSRSSSSSGGGSNSGGGSGGGW